MNLRVFKLCRNSKHGHFVLLLLSSIVNELMFIEPMFFFLIAFRLHHLRSILVDLNEKYCL